LQNVKKFPGVIPPDPRGGRGRPPPCTLPQLGLRPRAGALRAPGSAVPKGRQLNVALGRQMCKAGPGEISKNFLDYTLDPINNGMGAEKLFARDLTQDPRKWKERK
jgi:hypothetical protein